MGKITRYIVGWALHAAIGIAQAQNAPHPSLSVESFLIQHSEQLDAVRADLKKSTLKAYSANFVLTTASLFYVWKQLKPLLQSPQAFLDDMIAHAMTETIRVPSYVYENLVENTSEGMGVLLRETPNSQGAIGTHAKQITRSVELRMGAQRETITVRYQLDAAARKGIFDHAVYEARGPYAHRLVTYELDGFGGLFGRSITPTLSQAERKTLIHMLWNSKASMTRWGELAAETWLNRNIRNVPYLPLLFSTGERNPQFARSAKFLAGLGLAIFAYHSLFETAFNDTDLFLSELQRHCYVGEKYIAGCYGRRLASQSYTTIQKTKLDRELTRAVREMADLGLVGE